MKECSSLFVCACAGLCVCLGSREKDTRKWAGSFSSVIGQVMDTSPCSSQRFEANQYTHTRTQTTGCFAGSCDQSVAVAAWDGRLILSLFPVSSFSDSLFTLFLFLADLLFVSVFRLIYVSHPLLFSLSLSYCKFCPTSSSLCGNSTLPQFLCYFPCLTLFIVCVVLSVYQNGTVFFLHNAIKMIVFYGSVLLYLRTLHLRCAEASSSVS